MTGLAPAAPLKGVQLPRLCHIPPHASTDVGDDAIDLASVAGIELDPWQQYVIRNSLAETAEGKWAAFEVLLEVVRQQGKGTLLETRELVGLFLLGERLIVHSAHLFDTALEAFRRIMERIESSPDLDSRVKRVSRSHGEEGVELKNGQRLRFRARTAAGSGRGLTADLLILDEAMYLTESTMSGLMPTLSSRPNPQIWYVGSAVDQLEHTHGLTMTRVRNRGIAGTDPALAMFSWSAPGTIEDHDPLDRRLWAMANPALGYRISEEHIEREQRSMTRRGFAVERLGIGDWPDETVGDKAIKPEAWAAQATDGTGTAAQFAGPVAFAVETKYDRSSTSISVAWTRVDGLPCVEVVDNRPGTAWVPDAVALLVKKRDPVAIAVDPGSPTGALILDIENKGIELFKPSTREVAQACGSFLSAVEEGQLFHTSEPLLNDAVRVVTTRDLAGGFAWERKNANANTGPLMGVTLALYALEANGQPKKPPAEPQMAAVGPDPELDAINWDTLNF